MLLVEWIDGRTFDDADLDDHAQLARVAATCAGGCTRRRAFVDDFDMFDVQRRYLAIVARAGLPAAGRLPRPSRRPSPRSRRSLRASAPATVPCHNDLLAANIMDDGDRLWFIDYEYAGNNDPCFELGNIWSEAALDADRLDHLVAGYFGAPSPVQVARARLFGLMAKYGWTLWASIQAAVSERRLRLLGLGLEKYDRALAEFARPRPRHASSRPSSESIRHEGAEPWPTPSR